MLAAASFVKLCRTNHNYRIVITRWLTIDQSLRSGGRLSTHHTYGVQLVNPFCLGHKYRNRSEGLTTEIGIQPGNDHPQPTISQVLRYINDPIIKKLRFVDGHDCGLII
jgi:hypothetical protein